MAEPYVPRPDDLEAGIRASLAGKRPEDLDEEEDTDEERELYKQSLQSPPITIPIPLMISNEGLSMLTETSNRYEEPLSHLTTTKLHAHQLAELMEMVKREKTGMIDIPSNKTSAYLPVPNVGSYNDISASIYTNVGILGDIPGYGKSLTALALVGTRHDIHPKVSVSVSLGVAGAYVASYNTYAPTSTDCNLLLCPRRLLKHWVDEIRTKTTLRYLVVSKCVQILTNMDIRDVDIVVALPNTHAMCVKLCWKRIIVDEADTIKLPGTTATLLARYIWLISSSYNMLATNRHGWVQRDILAAFLPHKHQKRLVDDGRRSLLNMLVVRSEDAFVTASANTEEYSEEVILCSTPGLVKASREFISDEVAEMIASGDIEHAIVALGGQAGTQTNVMDLIKHNTQRELGNEQLTLKHVQQLDIDEIAKTQRVKRCQERIRHLTERIKEIEVSVHQIGSAECKICYDDAEGPTILLCCHNVFCGRCLIGWFNQWNKSTCPMCRKKVDIKTQMVSVTPEQILPDGRVDKMLAKLDALRLICQERKRVLVFANHKGSLSLIYTALIKVIPCEIFSNTNTSSIQRYKEGKLRVLLMDPQSTTGLALTETDTVVIYHGMDRALEMQAIGRAQRLGRTSRLEVYRLKYITETQ